MHEHGAGRPRVGVVIRTLNESRLIARCLETLRRQQPGFALDVLVVDSGSTDATLAIAQEHGARTCEIAPAEFDFSRALNLGIERVAGDIVLILSAHAIPVDERWAERMLAPFADPAVAGVACRQLPWPDAPWREVARLASTFGPDRRAYAAGCAEAPLFSNAASAVRRSAWRRHPFTLPAVEDLDWARRVVDAGWTVVYEPAACVYHSHSESPRAQARRLIDISRVEPGPRTRRRTLAEAAGLLYRDARTIGRLDASPRRKAEHLAEAARTAGYYVVDFSGAGSTAERRLA